MVGRQHLCEVSSVSTVDLLIDFHSSQCGVPSDFQVCGGSHTIGYPYYLGVDLVASGSAFEHG